MESSPAAGDGQHGAGGERTLRLEFSFSAGCSPYEGFQSNRRLVSPVCRQGGLKCACSRVVRHRWSWHETGQSAL